MLRVFSCFMIAVTAILFGSSCQCNQSTVEQTTCLWKIDSEYNTVYLLGSIHILRQEDHPLPKLMEDAFYDADALVFEIDLGSAETMGAQYMMFSKARGDGPDTLQTMLTEDAYDIAAQHVVTTTELAHDGVRARLETGDTEVDSLVIVDDLEDRLLARVSSTCRVPHSETRGCLCAIPDGIVQTTVKNDLLARTDAAGLDVRNARHPPVRGIAQSRVPAVRIEARVAAC